MVFLFCFVIAQFALYGEKRKQKPRNKYFGTPSVAPISNGKLFWLIWISKFNQTKREKLKNQRKQRAKRREMRRKTRAKRSWKNNSMSHWVEHVKSRTFGKRKWKRIENSPTKMLLNVFEFICVYLVLMWTLKMLNEHEHTRKMPNKQSQWSALVMTQANCCIEINQIEKRAKLYLQLVKWKQIGSFRLCKRGMKDK